MSAPAAGTYYIVNRVLSSTGDKLAITFAGAGKTATVTPLTNATSQKWDISDDFDGRTINPVGNFDLEAAWGDGVVTVIAAGGYTWPIASTSNGYTIQDGGKTVFWGLGSAASNSQVTIAGGTGGEKQNWSLVKV